MSASTRKKGFRGSSFFRSMKRLFIRKKRSSDTQVQIPAEPIIPAVEELSTVPTTPNVTSATESVFLSGSISKGNEVSVASTALGVKDKNDVTDLFGKAWTNTAAETKISDESQMAEDVDLDVINSFDRTDNEIMKSRRSVRQKDKRAPTADLIKRMQAANDGYTEPTVLIFNPSQKTAEGNNTDGNAVVRNESSSSYHGRSSNAPLGNISEKTVLIAKSAATERSRSDASDRSSLKRNVKKNKSESLLPPSVKRESTHLSSQHLDSRLHNESDSRRMGYKTLVTAEHLTRVSLIKLDSEKWQQSEAAGYESLDAYTESESSENKLIENTRSLPESSHLVASPSDTSTSVDLKLATDVSSQPKNPTGDDEVIYSVVQKREKRSATEVENGAIATNNEEYCSNNDYQTTITLSMKQPTKALEVESTNETEGIERSSHFDDQTVGSKAFSSDKKSTAMPAAMPDVERMQKRLSMLSKVNWDEIGKPAEKQPEVVVVSELERVHSRVKKNIDSVESNSSSAVVDNADYKPRSIVPTSSSLRNNPSMKDHSISASKIMTPKHPSITTQIVDTNGKDNKSNDVEVQSKLFASATERGTADSAKSFKMTTNRGVVTTLPTTTLIKTSNAAPTTGSPYANTKSIIVLATGDTSESTPTTTVKPNMTQSTGVTESKFDYAALSVETGTQQLRQPKKISGVMFRDFALSPGRKSYEHDENRNSLQLSQTGELVGSKPEVVSSSKMVSPSLDKASRIDVATGNRDNVLPIQRPSELPLPAKTGDARRSTMYVMRPSNLPTEPSWVVKARELQSRATEVENNSVSTPSGVSLPSSAGPSSPIESPSMDTESSWRRGLERGSVRELVKKLQGQPVKPIA